jgi:EAL domain-containing protein (putative c-di-GMP-specific phosphodiesterase class I)
VLIEEAPNAAAAARGTILEAHRSGRQSRVAAASETATSESISSTDLEKEVRWAVQGEQFVLQYAPVVELVGRRTVTLATPLRWDHPLCGLVPPEQFMPLLDKLDLRSSLDRWILQRGSRDLAHWSERGSTRDGPGLELTRQATDTENFVAEVAAAAAETDLHLSRLDFDVDAKTLATGSRVRGQLRELRKLGARVFLEDFSADGIALGAWGACRLTGSRLHRGLLLNSFETQALGPSAVQRCRSLALSVSGAWLLVSPGLRSWISCTSAAVSSRLAATRIAAARSRGLRECCQRILRTGSPFGTALTASPHRPPHVLV